MMTVDVVKNFRAFKKSKAKKTGLFTYDEEPPSIIDVRDLLLVRYSTASLDKLDGQEELFFLIVEGSHFDWAGYANEIDYIKSEFIEFDSIIEAALNFEKKHLHFGSRNSRP